MPQPRSAAGKPFKGTPFWSASLNCTTGGPLIATLVMVPVMALAVVTSSADPPVPDGPDGPVAPEAPAGPGRSRGAAASGEEYREEEREERRRGRLRRTQRQGLIAERHVPTPCPSVQARSKTLRIDCNRARRHGSGLR